MQPVPCHDTSVTTRRGLFQVFAAALVAAKVPAPALAKSIPAPKRKLPRGAAEKTGQDGWIEIDDVRSASLNQPTEEMAIMGDRYQYFVPVGLPVAHIEYEGAGEKLLDALCSRNTVNIRVNFGRYGKIEFSGIVTRCETEHPYLGGAITRLECIVVAKSIIATV